MAASYPAETAASAGLPQFDPEWFASQLFWLIIVFSLLYWLLSQAILPKIAQTIEARAKKIADDVGAAQAANDEAQASMAHFERTIAAARAEARAQAEAVRAEAERQRAAAIADIERKLDQRLRQAEARLADARAKAVLEARSIGEEAAREVVAKLAPRASQGEAA